MKKVTDILVNIKGKTWNVLLVMCFLFGINMSCQKENKQINFYDEEAYQILDIMKENPELYSSFLKICEAGGISGALRAFNPYGNQFTFFLPTNDAVDKFIQNNINYNSLDDLLADNDFVRIFCRFHLVNSAYRSNDFPLGALKDTTVNGDFISVSYQSNFETGETDIFLNNEARIIQKDILAVNGVVHIIDNCLTPITFSSYEWLTNNEEFSLMAQVFSETGLVDTMGLYRRNKNGEIIRNIYTLLVEPDSVFKKRGISDFTDLVNTYSTSGLDLDDPNNGFYQFAAYHILEGDYFLDGLATGIYNSYAIFPVSISVGTTISINRGFKNIDTLVSGIDTTVLNYIPVSLSLSNNPTKNGPVHVITEILELYKPKIGNVTYQFYDETLINEVRNDKTTHFFDDPSKMLKFDWSGTRYLIYENGTANTDEASMKDYIYFNGPFVVEYEVPKTPSGNYNLIIRANSRLENKASIQVLIDGKRVGSTLNMNSTSSRTWVSFVAGTVELVSFSSHIIRIESIVPGQFAWDYIQFIPVIEN